MKLVFKKNPLDGLAVVRGFFKPKVPKKVASLNENLWGLFTLPGLIFCT
jgi:hypothetical protein